MKFAPCAALAALVFAASCRSMRLPETYTPSEPYVQLKNGQLYEGTSADRNSGLFVKDKIILDGVSYPSRDVAFYSTGAATYANVNKTSFAPQITSGRINVYTYTYVSTTTGNAGAGGTFGSAMPSTRTHTLYYIQQGRGTPVQPLSYGNLRPMLATGTPEYKMLERYRNTRIVSRSLGYGALGLLGAGTVLISTPNSAVSNAGGVMVGTAFLAFMTWLPVYMTNQMKILKALVLSTKPDRGAAPHKRIR